MNAGSAAFAKELDLDALCIRGVNAAQRGLAIIGKDFNDRFVNENTQMEQLCTRELEGASVMRP